MHAPILFSHFGPLQWKNVQIQFIVHPTYLRFFGLLALSFLKPIILSPTVFTGRNHDRQCSVVYDKELSRIKISTSRSNDYWKWTTPSAFFVPCHCDWIFKVIILPWGTCICMRQWFSEKFKLTQSQDSSCRSKNRFHFVDNNLRFDMDLGNKPQSLLRIIYHCA